MSMQATCSPGHPAPWPELEAGAARAHARILRDNDVHVWRVSLDQNPVRMALSWGMPLAQSVELAPTAAQLLRQVPHV